jgi:hydrogenase small subunit
MAMTAGRTPTAGVGEVHSLWTSEGMTCDGDSVSITAATQPSLEDVVLGLSPGLPKVHLHNKVLDPSLGGEEFMKAFPPGSRWRTGRPLRPGGRRLHPQ